MGTKNGRKVRGPKTKEYMINDILLLKKNDINNKLSAKDIREKLAKIHNGSKYIPQVRVIQKIIQKNRHLIKYSDLDLPWSVGCCIDQKIPADMIPKLLLMQQFSQKVGQIMTIRHARWFSCLHPIVREFTKSCSQNLIDVVAQIMAFLNLTPKRDLFDEYFRMYQTLEKVRNQGTQSEKESLTQIEELAWLALIGTQYAKQEENAELVIGNDKNKPLFTSELDTLYFVKQDWSAKTLFEGVGLAYLRREIGQPLPDFGDLSPGEAEQVFGVHEEGSSLAQIEVKHESNIAADDFIRALKKGIVAAHEWIEKNPKEWAELNDDKRGQK